MPDRVSTEWNQQWIKAMAHTGALGLLAMALLACEAQPSTSSPGERSRAQAHVTGTGRATVTLVNNPPDALDDTLTVDEDSTDTVVNVLANDTTAPDTGETLTVTEVTQPASGSVTLSGGVVRFTPAANFVGATSFAYTVSDGNGGTDTAMVTVTVTPVNDPPDAVDDIFTVAEDSGATLLDVLANDTTAPDTGETLTVTSVTQPANGMVTFTPTDVRFTPATNFNGTTSFTYTIFDDNGGADTATVTVHVTPVNDPPMAMNDTLTVARNSTNTVVNVLANDSPASDTDETLTVTAVYPSTSGTVTLSEGVVRYSAPVGFTGTDMFGYEVSDGNGGTDTATVTVNIMPSGTGGWSTTGPLGTARYWHTATLLPSGKVLVAGGERAFGGGTLSSTELYDPVTEVWSTTGAMAAGRLGHTATLLSSGKVLVTGGAFPGNAEVYDPATGAWSPTGAMTLDRYGHTATLLPSGKVLVTGGYGWGNILSSAEVYDPDTGSWTSTNDMATARWYHTATLLPSGKVLITGGMDSTHTPIATAEVYDPDTGSWTPTNDMATARYWHTATLLPSGKVLVAGGQEAPPLSVESAEVYDPVTELWSSTGAMAVARAAHTATLLPSGRVLITGGMDSTQNSVASAEVYDPAAGVWSSTGGMAVDRVQHTATLLLSGQVLVTGMEDLDTSAEVYREFTAPDAPVVDNPPNGSTTSDPTPGYSGTANAGSTVTVIVDGVAMGSTTAGTTGNWSLTPPTHLADGPHTVKAFATNTGGTSPDSDTHTFTVARDQSTGGWSTTGALVTARTGHTATVLPSRKVLVTGGEDSSGALSSAEVYDPSTGGWNTTGALATARRNHSATVLPLGKVLVIGGEGSGSSGPLASTELYDPDTGTWSTTGALATARSGHTATVLPSGKVLVIGGEGSSGPLSSAELYDPDTGTWSTTNSLATARKNHSATVLLSGHVLVTGGEDASGPLASTELYDPDTESWRSTGALATARGNPSAVLLPSGRVLIAGGMGPGGALSSTEVYAPSTEVWSPTGLLATARQGHTATVLPSGHVLITGGLSAGGDLLSNVEIYEAVGASRPAASLPEARTDFMTVLLPNGLVLVAGGSDTSGPLSSARLYNPLTGLWTEAANMLTPRSSATATLLPTGQVLVTGGRAVARQGLQAPSADSGEVLASAELYDPGTNTWRYTGSLNDARYSHSATLLSTGQVLVTGGLDANDALRTTAEVYDVAKGTWIQTNPMHVARRQHMVAQLATGQVLVAGGLDADNNPLASAEVYDPVQREWTETAPMSTARAASTAVPLPTSQVMVVGGTNRRGVLSTAEVYEPVRREWIPAEPLNTARKSHTALLLPTGRVLIMGGSDGSGVLDGVEVYDTAQNKWEKLAQLTGPREDSMTVQLPTGQVLVLGGSDLLGPLENTELYDEFGPPAALRPVVDELPPQRRGDRPTVHGRGFMAPPGGSSRVRMQLAPKGALRELPADELTDTSVQTALAGVPDGFHLLFVMVNDIAGGRVVQVDGTPPHVPSVKAFANTPRPTLSGTAEPYSTVQVSLGGEVEGSAQADFKGDWKLPLTHALTDGTYTATATAMDATLNVSPSSPPFTFVVDTQAPEAPVVTPLEPFISKPRPTLSGTAEPGSTVSVSLDATVRGTAKADTMGLWSLPLPQALEDGKHSASATAMDDAGNTSPSSEVITFTVDTHAPAAPEVLKPEEGETMASGTITISGTAEQDSTVTVSMDGKVKGTATADSKGLWSLTLSAELENGQHTLSATARDAAGNVSLPSAERSFTVQNDGIVVPVGGCSGCAASPGEPSLVLLSLAALRRLLSRRRSTQACASRTSDPRSHTSGTWAEEEGAAGRAWGAPSQSLLARGLGSRWASR